MDYLYKSTFKNRLSHFFPAYLIIIAFGLLVIYMTFRFGTDDLLIYFYIGFCIYGLGGFLPTLYIHLTYLITNFKDEMIINFENEIIKYKHKEHSVLFHFSDICQIDEYKTYALSRKTPGWLPWDTYHYNIYTLKNGEKIIITCFMANELKLPIDNGKIKLHKIVYPYIK